MFNLIGMFYCPIRDEVVLVFDQGEGQARHCMPASEFLDIMSLVSDRSETVKALKAARSAAFN